MKNKILFLLAFCFSVGAFAAPCELRLTQRNNIDSTSFMRAVPPPSCATSAILMHNGGTELPQYAQLGSGLSWNGTTLAVTPAWSSLTGVPSTFAPSAHTHPSTDISDSTATGRSVLTAANAAAARTAIGAGTGNSNFDGAYASLTGTPTSFPPSAHTHPSTDISDSTSTGRSLLTAADASAARSIIGAGTSSFSGAYSALTGIPTTFAPSAHTHLTADLSDSTTLGRSLVMAASPSDARTAIGAGTGNSNFDGAYASLTGIPSAFAPSPHTHLAADISNSSTVGRNVLTAGTQADARTAIGAGTSSFSGSYSALTGIPSTFAPSAHTHVSTDVSDSTATGRSVLTAANAAAARTAIGAGTSNFDGAYTSLTGTPTTFTPAAHVHAATDITSGVLADARIPSLAISKTTGLQTALDAKFNTPAGTTAQYVRGDGSLATLPTVASQVVNEPTRSLVSATNATGYQISATRNALACYDGLFTTTSTIGGPSSGSVVLETADTNSTTPGDWSVKATQTSSQTITLAVVLQSVDGEPWSFCRIIPAGKFVRLRTITNAGSVSFTINTPAQETLF